MKHKRITLLLVVLLIAAMAQPVLAVQFTDISGHWGREYIEEMAEKGLVSGSDDPATGNRVYRPDSPVTKPEALIMLYSVLDEVNALISQDDHTSQYRSIMQSASIPEWSMKQVAYALRAEIISVGDLADFMEDSGNPPAQKQATREEVAIYFGKAMDQDGDVNDTAATLDFQDAENISSQALPYVGYLVEEGIFSGDNQNRFNPRQTITRAEMATIMKRTIENLKDEPIVIQLPDNGSIQDEGEGKRVNGEIDHIFSDTKTIIIVDEEGNTFLYEVTDDSEIIIDEEPAEFKDLRENQTVQVRVNEDNEILKIEVNPQSNQLKAVIDRYFDVSDYYVLDVISLERSDEERRFRVHDDAEIIIGDRDASISDLKNGDEVIIYHDGLNAVRITSLSQHRIETQGIIDDFSLRRYPYTITIITVGNREMEYEIAEDVRVYLDGRRGDLDGLSRGDIVSLVVEDDEVVNIDAVTRNRDETVKGTILEIVISRPNRITILDEDDEEVTYSIRDGAAVYLEGDRASLGDLSSNASVELTLRGSEVVEIEAGRSVGRNLIQGEITRFYDSINRMIVNHLNPSTDRYERISVYVNRDTVYIDEDGRRIDFGDLDRDDYVIISGYYEDDSFIAGRVIVVDN
ncbi:MAG: hypothetical protein D5S00_11790 [Tindallia sp. MSAO_Bac2]|nr:MAG: hypothetical protein D5S00_11790 [Tindallia sp. MSAO_Bac2]